MKKFLCRGILGLGLVCASCVTVNPVEYAPSFEESACEFDAPADAEVECGFVIVPEDRSGVITDTIQLAVALFPARSRTAEAEPVIYLEGGPGGPAIDGAISTYPMFVRKLSQRHDVVVFDQRGTGYSEPSLVCREAKEQLESLATALATETDEYFEDDCIERLEREGVNPAAYNTLENAADVRDVLIALGYEQAILYGSSYGTTLALTTMRNHPEMVYSAILDGAAPPQINRTSDLIAKIGGGIERILAACAARPACTTAYPDLEEVYYNLVAHFDAEPATMTPINPLTGEREEVELDATMFVSLSFFLLFVDQNIALWPQVIYEARDGDYSTLENYASLLVDITVSDTLSHGMNLLVNCADQVLRDEPPDMESLIQRYPQLEPYIRAYYEEYLADAAQRCEEWGAQPTAADQSEAVVSDIPTLILTGEFDVQTPLEWAAIAAETLSRHTLVTVPGTGHVTAVKGECPVEIILQFVEAPMATPDSSCLESMPQLVFAAPGVQTPTQVVEVTDPDGTAMSTVLPVAWNEVPTQPGMFASPDGTQAVVLIVAPRSAQIEDLIDAFGGGSPAEYSEESLDNYDWTIARLVDEDDNHFLLGAALDARHSYFVVGISAALVSDVDLFYETVFLSALDGLIVEAARQGS